MPKYTSTDPAVGVDLRIDSTGFGSVKPETVVELLRRTVKKYPDHPALRFKGIKEDGSYTPFYYSVNWTSYFNTVKKIGKSLIHLGLAPHSIINIIGFNSPEWILSLVGAIYAGCIGAGVYATNSTDACKYIADHSKAEVIFVEDNKQLAKYATFANDLPHLKAIVSWGKTEIDSKLTSKIKVPVYPFKKFLSLGAEVSDDELEKRANDVKVGECASLIYTSGTTGPPKAVMISNDNLTWTSRNLVDHYLVLDQHERIVSFLPLSHIAAQLIDVFCTMQLGCTLTFARPDALKGTLTQTLQDVRPTLFFGVPRVWEKIQEKMIEIGRNVSGPKKKIAAWAKAKGTKMNEKRQYGSGKSQKPSASFKLADKVVLSQIKKALGLDKAKGCFTAAAPISQDTLRYFASLNLPVYEVFGQSECTGPHGFSIVGQWKIGYCGRPMLGTISKIDEATGELCYTGRHIFMGYMYMDEDTKKTIDEEGYLHSGDIAEFDDNNIPEIPAPSGFLKITGRIKELLITAGGENVPPVIIENFVKSKCIAVSNAMVVGDRKKFLTMLVSLKVEVDSNNNPTDKLAPDSLFIAKEIGSTATTYSEAREDPLFHAYIEEGRKYANANSTSNAQIVQKWAWLPVDFSESAGDLTPTLKLKRNVVTKKYEDLINSLYEGTD